MTPDVRQMYGVLATVQNRVWGRSSLRGLCLAGEAEGLMPPRSNTRPINMAQTLHVH
jgi:hypothetical protein